MHPAADRIRNVALVGHRGSGKTSLHEALLFEAGATNRLGSVPDQSTVSDSDPDEQARQMSISASLSSLDLAGPQDQPARHARRAELRRRRARRAARLRVRRVRVNAVMGVEVTTSRLWARAAELDIARMLFVNMLDRERADFFRTLEGLKRAFGQHVVATEIPIGTEHETRRRDRPRRHEGLPRAAHPERGGCERDPDPRRRGRARAGIPREADGRGLRSLRRADGALPRRRRDLPRGDRRRAQGGHQPRQDLPGRLRRRDRQPRHDAAARRDRRGPALAGQARLAAGRRGRADRRARTSRCSRTSSRPARTRSRAAST